MEKAPQEKEKKVKTNGNKKTGKSNKRKSVKNQPAEPPRKGLKGLTWYIFAFLLFILLYTTFSTTPTTYKDMDFGALIDSIEQGKVKDAVIKTTDQVVVSRLTSGEKYRTYYIDYPLFIQNLREHGVQFRVDPRDSSWMTGVFVQALLPFILIALLWFFIFRQAQGANNQALSFGKSRAKPWEKTRQDKITFADVAGVDEAVEEVKEIVDFLRTPEKFIAVGAKIPKGVLLMGPPGTGKTLLARAIAGEAEVAFFSLSGSDFVEMFVGVGASRVRDLFRQAKKAEPAIIFVDEIDAVGRHRGAGFGGGHDEREQTLNQLLVEMDGFDPKSSTIVVAATNRPDILDPALLRPGRFDRQIVVDKPDLKGRHDIMKIHTKNKKFGDGVDLEVIARRTPGFTGADLANLVNEAALLTARRDKSQITMDELEESIERVMAGPQRKSRLISEKEKQIIAYHEVGHALVAHQLPGTDPVHKISILPRGMALGYTLQLPLEDKYLVRKTEMLDQIKIMMGGRVAEEMIFDEITSGAANDIQKATELVRRMVCRYAMTELGFRTYGKEKDNVFLGKDWSDHKQDYSEDMAKEIDRKIDKILGEAYRETRAILEKNRERLNRIAGILIEKELLEGETLDQLLDDQRVVDTVIK